MPQILIISACASNRCGKSLSPDFSFVVFSFCVLCVYSCVESNLAWLELKIRKSESNIVFLIMHIHSVMHRVDDTYTYHSCANRWGLRRMHLKPAAYSLLHIINYQCILNPLNTINVTITMHIMMIMYMTSYSNPTFSFFFLPGAWEQHTQNPPFHNWDLVATHYPAAVQYRTLEV